MWNYSGLSFFPMIESSLVMYLLYLQTGSQHSFYVGVSLHGTSFLFVNFNHEDLFLILHTSFSFLYYGKITRKFNFIHTFKEPSLFYWGFPNQVFSLVHWQLYISVLRASKLHSILVLKLWHMNVIHNRFQPCRHGTIQWPIMGMTAVGKSLSWWERMLLRYGIA